MRGSRSTAITFFATSSSFNVKLPVPGPISSTISVDFTPACDKKKKASKFGEWRTIASTEQKKRHLLHHVLDDERILQNVLTK
jgi:hypothetical protein